MAEWLRFKEARTGRWAPGLGCGARVAVARTQTGAAARPRKFGVGGAGGAAEALCSVMKDSFRALIVSKGAFKASRMAAGAPQATSAPCITLARARPLRDPGVGLVGLTWH